MSEFSRWLWRVGLDDARDESHASYQCGLEWPMVRRMAGEARTRRALHHALAGSSGIRRVLEGQGSSTGVDQDSYIHNRWMARHLSPRDARDLPTPRRREKVVDG